MTAPSTTETKSGGPALPRVFVLGSSLTIHFGPWLEKALEGHFAYDRKRDSGGERAEDNLDIPQGASAGDSSQVLAYLRLRREQDPIPADILLLSCGLHDIRTDPATGRRHLSDARFESNLQKIIGECDAMNLRLVWLRIPPVVEVIHNSRSRAFHRFTADVDSCNRIADRVMRGAEVDIIDLHHFCQALLPDALIDHVHYNEGARKQQAAFIATELRNLYSSHSPNS